MGKTPDDSETLRSAIYRYLSRYPISHCNGVYKGVRFLTHSLIRETLKRESEVQNLAYSCKLEIDPSIFISLDYKLFVNWNLN